MEERKNCKELEQGKYIDFSYVYICDDGNFNLIFLLAFLASIAIIQLCVFFSVLSELKPRVGKKIQFPLRFGDYTQNKQNENFLHDVLFGAALYSSAGEC